MYFCIIFSWKNIQDWKRRSNSPSLIWKGEKNCCPPMRLRFVREFLRGLQDSNLISCEYFLYFNFKKLLKVRKLALSVGLVLGLWIK